MGKYKDNMQFEAEVRWIAEAVWGMAAGSCQPSHYPGDPVVRELDGIARLRDVTHLIMVTTSTKLEKAKADVKKLGAAEAIERRDALAVSKWLITERQLDAEHVEHARRNNVTVLTLEQFKQRFFDGRSYLSKREVASFGSARNPSDNSVTISDDAYVALPMAIMEEVSVRVKKSVLTEEKLTPVDVNEICGMMEKGKIIVLLAPFGSGKSLTTREIFRNIAAKYRKSEFQSVPVCLNLREHWGQEYFDEMLERHARSIGFKPKEDLVIAWRSGVACLMLDGFDELASQTIVREDDINFMREARRTALTGVRDFLTKLPSGTGTFICGRDHYFDNNSELAHALGVSRERLVLVKLDEFTEEGANTFLKKHGFNDPLPQWLPRKPLILSYLIQKELLGEILKIDSSEGYGYAWDTFIERITQRESELERAVMDARTLRSVMERLAFFVRSLSSGNGPITGSDLATTYNIETGQAPGEGVLAQLQRLPGLTQRDQEAGSRSFVDPDMLAALQGGAIARFVSGNYESVGNAPLSALSERAIDVATYLLKKDGVTASTVLAIANRLVKESSTLANLQLISDCLALSLSLAKEENLIFDGHGITVESASYGRLDLEETEVRNISFSNCTVEEVVIAHEMKNSGVIFRGCLIGRIKGVANRAGLPSYMFDDSCEFSEFDNMGTNSAVLNSDLEPQVKALLTVLRKLYRQSGAGRKLSAMSRGVTKVEVHKYIPMVLELMERHGFAKTFNQVVHPVRNNASRVESILNAPSLSTDDLIVAARAL